MTGWDVAGVVERADGSGPSAGARVVGLAGTGAWAQLAAVPAGRLAAIPDEVSDTQRAAIQPGQSAPAAPPEPPGTAGPPPRAHRNVRHRVR